MGKNKKTIKVLMVGGKRCGKTTVLASLNKESNNVFKGKMTMNAVDNNTGFALTDKIEEIEDYFVDAGPQDFFTPDDNPNFEEMKYEFALNITGMFSTGITVEFIDVPGEWFKLGNPNNNTVKEYIQSSNVLLIAIDTPYLMEDRGKMDLGYGMRHSAANKSIEITEFIRTKLSVEDIEDRLILFVPLKCEKYYYQNRMDKVVQAVRKGYEELLDYLTGPGLKDNCTVAITPILSMGGIEFFSFGESAELNNDIARKDQYIFRQKDEQRKYNPKYCGQPLIYTLAFLLKILEKGKYRTGALVALKKWFADEYVSLKDLQKEMGFVNDLLIKDKSQGYEIVQNPLGI